MVSEWGQTGPGPSAEAKDKHKTDLVQKVENQAMANAGISADAFLDAMGKPPRKPSDQ